VPHAITEAAEEAERESQNSKPTVAADVAHVLEELAAADLAVDPNTSGVRRE
jgi:hypothetical protein